MTGETLKVRTQGQSGLSRAGPELRPWYPALSTPPLLGTPQVKTQLSLLKGSWNKALAGWVFPAGEP